MTIIKRKRESVTYVCHSRGAGREGWPQTTVLLALFEHSHPVDDDIAD